MARYDVYEYQVERGFIPSTQYDDSTARNFENSILSGEMTIEKLIKAYTGNNIALVKKVLAKGGEKLIEQYVTFLDDEFKKMNKVTKENKLDAKYFFHTHLQIIEAALACNNKLEINNKLLIISAKMTELLRNAIDKYFPEDKYLSVMENYSNIKDKTALTASDHLALAEYFLAQGPLKFNEKNPYVQLRCLEHLYLASKSEIISDQSTASLASDMLRLRLGIGEVISFKDSIDGSESAAYSTEVEEAYRTKMKELTNRVVSIKMEEQEQQKIAEEKQIQEQRAREAAEMKRIFEVEKDRANSHIASFCGLFYNFENKIKIINAKIIDFLKEKTIDQQEFEGKSKENYSPNELRHYYASKIEAELSNIVQSVENLTADHKSYADNLENLKSNIRILAATLEAVVNKEPKLIKGNSILGIRSGNRFIEYSKELLVAVRTLQGHVFEQLTRHELYSTKAFTKYLAYVEKQTTPTKPTSPIIATQPSPVLPSATPSLVSGVSLFKPSHVFNDLKSLQKAIEDFSQLENVKGFVSDLKALETIVADPNKFEDAALSAYNWLNAAVKKVDPSALSSQSVRKDIMPLIAKLSDTLEKLNIDPLAQQSTVRFEG